MPVPAHVLYTWKGVFGTALAPAEEWQFSLKTDGDGPLLLEDYDVLAQAASDVYNTKLKTLMPAHVVLTSTEVARVEAGGLYSQTAEGQYRQGKWTGTLVGGTQGLPIFPFQTALTVSLLTNRAGPSGKGRFYIPCPALSLDTGGRISETVTTTLANAARDFVAGVNLIEPAVSVMSTKGFSTPVTGVRVGRVPDTQRRRRGDLIEAYVTSLLP